MFSKIKFYLLPTILLFTGYFSQSNAINSFKINDIVYFSIEEFCNVEDCNIIYYEDKSKVAVIFDNLKITFSANLSFAQVDNKTINLLNGLIIKDENFFIPANSFNLLSKNFFIPKVSFDTITNKFKILPYDAQPVVNVVESQDTIKYIDFTDNFNINKSIKTIVLDAGHGGKDPGAIGYYNIKEKNVVLDITNELGRYIKNNHPDIDVVYTRTDDTFLGLRDRTNIANQNKGQIFISIHANASTAKSARGFEIFLLGTNSVDKAMEVTIRENASIAFEENQSQYETENQIIASHLQMGLLKESEKLAIFIENSVKKELPKTRIRGIKQAGFYVLVGASMPNILVEVGFISNKSEAKLLNKSGYRKQMAKGIYDGISQYIKYYEQKYVE